MKHGIRSIRDMALRSAACAVVIASAALPLQAGAPVRPAAPFPFSPSGRIDPARVNVLSGADAERIGEFQMLAPISHLKSEVVGWQDERQALRWTVTVPQAGDYAVSALLSIATKVPVTMTVSTDGASTSAPFQLDPGGGESRIAFATPLHLAAGRQVLTLRLTPNPGAAPFAAEFLALELTRPALRDSLHREALAMRADARWMARETFGIGVHWTKRTMPRFGQAKTYEEAVNAFDVERFTDQVASTGASILYLTTAHSDQYLPAPIKSLDAILPGRTTKRDLIAELIAALGKRHIKLFLYYHLGPIEDPAWTAATHEWDSDQTRFFANWQAIIGEMGTRYGKGLAGWWFDDGVYNYYYRSPDWAALDRAAKAGNPDRPICFNSWKGASATEFQDFYCGEEVVPGGLNDALNHDGSLNGMLAKGGDGRIRGGQFSGLQASGMFVVETDWVHTRRDSEAAAPKWTAQSLAGTLRQLKAHGDTPMVNMLVYQDGTIAPKSVAMVREAAALAGLR